MPRRFGLLVALITLAGAALRFYAIDFGLPDRFRPDEQYTVEPAALIGRAYGFNPRFAQYPAALTYLTSGIANAAQVLGGKPWPLTIYPSGRRRWYLSARLTVAALGTLTIPLTAALAARAAPAGAAAPAGVLAAALLAGAFLHVRDSHFATTDVPMTFWSTAAWLMLALVIRRGRLRDTIAAGALIGLASATKYPAITLVFPLAILAWTRSAAASWRGRLGHVLAGGAAVAATFFVASPYVVLDPTSTRHALVVKGGHVTGSGLLSPGSVEWLLGFALPAALGWPLVALALGALLWALMRGNTLERALAAWVLIATLPLVLARMVFLRYTLPLLPVMLVLLATCATRIGARGRHLAWAVTAIVLAALAPSVGRAVAFDRLVSRTDTRTEVREWMEANLPPATTVYSPAFGVARMYFAVPEPFPGTFSYAPAAEGAPRGAYVLVAEHWLPHAFPPTPALGAQLRAATELLDVNPGSGVGTPTFEYWDAFLVPLTGFAAVNRPGPRLRLYRLAP